MPVSSHTHYESYPTQIHSGLTIIDNVSPKIVGVRVVRRGERTVGSFF